MSSLPSTPRSLHGRHIPALDGVRGIAVLWVMVLHFTVTGGQPLGLVDRVAFGAFDLGWAGVDLFFVLSGFLITGILLDTRDDPRRARNFWMRRTLRIFPLYFGALAVLFVVLPALFPDVAELHQRSEARVWLWTYLSNVYMAVENSWRAVPPYAGHFWSLAVEEQFYLVWPFVIWAAGPRRLLPVCALVIGGAGALRLGLYLGWEASLAAHVLMPARMDSFAFGGIGALLLRDPSMLTRYRAHGRWLALGVAVALGVLGVWRGNGGWKLEAQDAAVLLFGYPLLAVGFTLVILAATEEGLLARLVDRRPLRFLGRYSYGLYVIHAPIAAIASSWAAEQGMPRILGSVLPANALLLAVGVGVTLAVAVPVHHWYEQPFLRLKRHFTTADVRTPDRSAARVA